MDSFKSWLEPDDMFGFKSQNEKLDGISKTLSLHKGKYSNYFAAHTDIYGFDKLSKLPDVEKNDNPIDEISTTKIINLLKNKKLGSHKVYEIYPDSLEWGYRDKNGICYPGCIELDLSPLGSWKAFISKLAKDLRGETIWICKQAVPLVDFKNEDEDVEDKIADVLYKNLTKINEDKPDVFKKEYDLLPLVKFIDNLTKKEHPIWFIPERTKKINNNRYITYFHLRGAGIGRLHPADFRVETFNIDINFYPESGVIRIFGQDIVSPSQTHEWIPSVSEFDLNFAPSQSIYNISHCLVHALHSY